MSIFTNVAVKKPRFNTFDLSHERKFATPAGGLTPCFLAETVPNDYWRIHTSHMVRVAPMVAPVMHRISAYVHFFFIPHRILWDGWEKFINGGYEGEDAPTFPFIAMNNIFTADGSLADYLGLPEFPASVTENVSAIPFAAYQKVWYEFFRDQNLSPEIDWLEPDGTGLVDGAQPAGVNTDLRTRRFRAWQHDYFTSALPWTQRGPEATIPLGSTAGIVGVTDPALGNLIFDGDSAASSRIQRVDNTAFAANDVTYPASSGLDEDAQITVIGEPAQINVAGHTYVDPSDLQVDLSSATAASINDLRRAFRLQEWLELNARAGARYVETIQAHFGVHPGDYRTQRPIFLGGSSTPIVISEVLQTSATDTEPTPQGNMAGHGISVGGKNIVKYHCKEHGYILGLMSIMPKSAYQQGIPKHWQKFDKFDYFWRSFANIGEQPIYNKEIYLANDGENDTVFGYTPRYAEYKYMNDTVHGAFRSSLDIWHMGRKFAARPLLNTSFVYMNPQEISRVFAVSSLTDEEFYVQMHHQVKARRPMPYFGTPTI